MKIVIIPADEVPEDKSFRDLTDKEVLKIAEKLDCFSTVGDIYESVESLAAAWNTDEIFDPSNSYMRVIND